MKILTLSAPIRIARKGGNDYYRGTCFYAKEVQKEELPEGEQYYLEFLGVNASADVYVNGNHLAHHDGGYSTWRVNMTDALTDGKNLIVVAVDNSANDRVYPQKADFTFYGGMYRDVNIIAVHKSHFDLDYYGGNGLKVTPEVADKNAKIAVEVFLSGEKAGQQLIYQITDAEGVLAAETKTGISDKQVNLPLPPFTIHHILYFRETTVLGPFCHAVIHSIHRVKSQLTTVIIQDRMIVRTHHQLVLPGHKLIRLVIQIIQGTLPVQIKFQHRNLLVVSQHDIIHRECRVRSQVMQVHLVVHGIEHIRELGMKGKTRRFVKIRGVQILVFRLLDKTVSRHVDPVNARAPPCRSPEASPADIMIFISCPVLPQE